VMTRRVQKIPRKSENQPASNAFLAKYGDRAQMHIVETATGVREVADQDWNVGEGRSTSAAFDG
jgi:hypothetical protein